MDNKALEPKEQYEISVVQTRSETSELPVEAVDSELSTSLPKEASIMESANNEARNTDLNVCEEVVRSAACKDEPTDTEMDLAEDFTQGARNVAVEPLVNIKQESQLSYQEKVARERAVESHAVLQIANSSLSLLSQYISSDSDSNITDSEEELQIKTTKTIKQESEDDSSEESVEILQNTSNYRYQQTAIVVSDTETAPNATDDESDGDLFSSEDETAPPVPVIAKGETPIHELPPIEELHITVSEKQCKPIGYVQSIVAQIVIVQSHAGVELLNIDTVLFLEKGKRSLGKIFDVIGQVAAPMYCVLFNSRQEVLDRGIKVGAPVYCAPQTEHTQFIILSDLMKQRGSDASWFDDGEIPEYALDYSDDEQERAARKQRNSLSTSTGRQTPEGPSRRPFYRRGRGGRGYIRGRQSGHSWHHNIQRMDQPQRVLNPFAVASSSGVILLPPPPPPPPSTH
ncbi:H/ACA ribonucleoprotein complex non-core subunit NAF1 [Topomyia yanbarensis]|uniref:H/ACA ribonucleoprotein complex non-core subunit NAF1 n=1 Tax=Topomyia yanbarensis TaxID=2498891 RepID=UPI00273A77DD|nr:H/ACA ribonucleoprotein complex non-core subunit NAF1 [Topomyia yanbarensis]